MESYREKLKNRTQQATTNRGTRGAGRKSILDLGMIRLPLFTPRSGKDKNYIDIMPWKITQPWYKSLRTRAGAITGLDVGDYDYKLEIPRHGNIGPGQDLALCLREAFGKNDPVCEDMFAEYQKRKDGNKEFNEKKARALHSSWRDFYIIYDYDQSDKGFFLWEIAYELFEKYLLDELATAEDGEGIIVPWDLQSGRSVEFKGREKKIGEGPAFIEAEGITFHKRDPYEESILAKIPSLDASLLVPTYEEIRDTYYGLEPGEDDKLGDRSEVQPPVEKEPAPRTRTRGGEGAPTPLAPETPAPTAGRSRREIPPPLSSASSVSCPAGGVFGSDCGRIQACQDEACDQVVYEACLKRRDDLFREAEKAKESSSSQPRTRRR